jgi:hypothetical protein
VREHSPSAAALRLTLREPAEELLKWAVHDDLLAVQPDPVTFDHIAVAKPIEPVNRVRAIASEEHHALVVGA